MNLIIKVVFKLLMTNENCCTTNVKGYPVTALREINILLALQHPYIVKVKEVVVGSSIDKVYMVMEFCENDLKTCMKLSRQSFSTAEVFLTLSLKVCMYCILVSYFCTYRYLGEAVNVPVAQRY